MRFAAVMGAMFVCASMAQADSPVVADRGLDGFVSVDRLPVPEASFLQEGRAIWADTCEGCHGGNKYIGAPKITSLKAWEPRIAQGMEVLIDHAVNGFVGPKYTEMPPRGANPDLTDEQVAAAVAFMVWTSGGDAVVETYLDTLTGEGS